jgi:hypothetical protein
MVCGLHAYVQICIIDADAHSLHNPQVEKVHVSIKYFPFPLAQRTLNGPSISLSGNLHPQKTHGIPSLHLGDRTLQLHESSGRVLVSQIPETQFQSTLTFLLSFQDFPYRNFSDCDVEKLVPTIPESRFSKTPILV